MSDEYDVIIIGAGAVGCAIARELSRYQLRVIVLEKAADVAAGTSGRNSAVVHAGFNNKPGSLMARLCVEGSQGFEDLCRELDIPYQRTGKYLVAFDQEDLRVLDDLVAQGEKNGVRGLAMIDETKLHRYVPNVGGIGAMYSPETAIINPFLYTIALAEHAADNGVQFYFNHEVTKILHAPEGFTVDAAGTEFHSRYLVNCGGVHSDKIAAMAGIQRYKLYPCRGEYFILDKITSQYLNVPVYPAPKKGIGGLGVHLTPTTDGNLMIGPSAEYIADPEDYACTDNVMDKLFREAKQLLPLLERKHIIGAYSGIRAKLAPKNEGGFRDFIIQPEPELPNMINLIGIESPGLTASVPIARMVVEFLQQRKPLMEKPFKAARKRPIRFREQSVQCQRELIAEDPEYGEIICRCEQVTKREVRDAIENSLGVQSITGIKYRCRATTGRCQGGYCLAKIVEILVKEYGVSPNQINYREPGSYLFEGVLREDFQ